MTYYSQIKKAVLPRMTNFQTDVTKHDKRDLRGYHGKFLHGSRDTGTGMVKLDLDFYSEMSLDDAIKEVEERFNFLDFCGRNDLFFYGENGVIREIEKSEIYHKKDILISELKEQRLQAKRSRVATLYHEGIL